jgi:Domain of unknown function (DUF397)
MTDDAQTQLGSPAVRLTRAIWRKSSYSGTAGNCVEVATNLPGIVAVRDSKNPNGPKLIISSVEWQAFVRGLKDRALG